MNKSESKYFNTAIRMDEAFMELLEEKDFEYISVKEICERAGVNRSTFYLHYETIGDLLEESVSYMNERFLEYFNGNGQSIAGRIDVADIKEFALRLADTYHRMFTHVLSPIMDRFSVSEKEKKYLLSFYMNGIMAVIKTWISGNCEDDIDFIVKIISERIPPKE